MKLSSIYSEAQWQWVAEKYRAGYSQLELARFLGVNRETIRRRFQKMGVLPEEGGRLPELDKKEFNSLR